MSHYKCIPVLIPKVITQSPEECVQFTYCKCNITLHIYTAKNAQIAMGMLTICENQGHILEKM